MFSGARIFTDPAARRAWGAKRVAGEFAGAFGALIQCSSVYPLIQHFRVELWLPEVGGRVGFTSATTEMLLGMLGGTSKQERALIRARCATAGRSWRRTATATSAAGPRTALGKQQKVDRLPEVDDLAAGYVTRQRWADGSTWIYGPADAHPTRVDEDLWDAVAARLATCGPRI